MSDHIRTAAARQLKPLERGKAEEFFLAMQELWALADVYGIQLPFTNFVFYGPQNAGKSSLIERILGFPVTLANTMATTRPLIVVTRSGPVDEIAVREGSHREILQEEEVMAWIAAKNTLNRDVNGDPIISSVPIYLTVSGPGRHPRRFVDLPGFQLNGATADQIADLLKAELDSNDHTVIVGVEEPVEMSQSVLVKSLERVFPGRSFADRMVFCMNKSDRFFLQRTDGEDACRFLADYIKPVGAHIGGQFSGG